MFATVAGGLEVAVGMAGYGYDLACPAVIGTELFGTLPDGVEAKDIVLEILRRYGVRGGCGAVFEFHGPAVAALSVSARTCLSCGRNCLTLTCPCSRRSVCSVGRTPTQSTRRTNKPAPQVNSSQ